MIYQFLIKLHDKKKQDKIYYLSADNTKDLYKRISSIYGIAEKDVEILKSIDDETLNINKQTVKTPINNNEYLNMAQAMLNSKINGIDSDIAKNKPNWHYKELIYPTMDLANLLKSYSQVKLYYIKTGARKNKQYCALYR